MLRITVSFIRPRLYTCLRLALMVLGLVLGSFLFGVGASSVAHPADTNADDRISIDELSAFHGTLPAAVEADGLGDPEFAQAWFIWRSGESYRTDGALPEPYRWIPVAAGQQFVSLSVRACDPLALVEVHGLPDESAPLTGRFRPANTQEWVSLDVEKSADATTFFAPYVPTPWLPTRDLEIEISVGGIDYSAGILRLLPVDRSQVDLLGFLESTRHAFGNLGDWQPATAVADLADEATTDPFLQVFGYYHAYASHAHEVLKILQKDASDPDAEVTFLAAAELFALTAGKTGRHETVRASADLGGGRDAGRQPRDARGSDCRTITTWEDLVEATTLRSKIEAKAMDESLAKKAQDKALEKLEEAAVKIGEKLAPKAKQLTKRIGLAFTIPMELSALLDEWDTKMLPKTFTKISYSRIHDGNGTTLPVPIPQDSPYSDKSCPLVCFDGLKADISSEGFSLGEYLLDSKVPQPDDLKGLADGAKGVALELLIDYYSKDLGQLRQSAIDKTYDKIKDFDYAPGSCKWTGIPIPQTRSDPKLTFHSTNLKFAANTSTAECLDMVAPGSDRIELRIKTTTNTEFGVNNLPNTPPYSEFINLSTAPPLLKFRPPAYSVDDVRDPPNLVVDIENSFENRRLKWRVYDVDGRKLHEEVTEVSSPSFSTESQHTLQGYTVPEDHTKYPLLAMAESQAVGCLEANATIPVREVATIYYQAKVFEITPTNICREPGEIIEIKAIPVEEDPDFEVTKWEVAVGTGTVEATGKTTATLQLPTNPDAEIVVKATGADDFESYGYYSTGPCIKYVQLSLVVGQDPSVLAEGTTYQSLTSDFTVGYGDFEPADLVVAPPVGPAPSFIGTDIVTGFSSFLVTFDKLVSTSASGVREFDVSAKGAGLALLDYQRAAVIEEVESADIGGSYFDPEDLAEPEEHVTHPIIGTPRTHPLDLIRLTDDVYQVFFHQELTKTEGIDESGLLPTWQTEQGEVIEVTAPTPDPDNPESYYFDVLIEYPRTVKKPDVNLTLSGSIRYPDDPERPSDGFYSSATFRFQKVELNVEGTVKVDIQNGRPVVCGPDFPNRQTTLISFLDGCCGNVEITDYERIRGSARQSKMLSGEGTEESIGNFTNFILLYSNEPELPFCEEQRRFRERHPERPEDIPDPDEPVDPPTETPPELVPYFADSPTDLEGEGRFPAVDAPLSSGTSSGANFVDDTIYYPFDELDIATAGNEMRLGSFSAASGTYLSSELWLDSATRDLLATELRLILFGKTAAASSHGVFVEREFNDSRTFEFWERDPAAGKFIAREILALAGEGQHVIGLGDFNQDGSLDYAGRDATGNLLLWAGTNAAPSSATTWLPAQDSWVPRAAAVLPNGTTMLVSDQAFGFDARVQILSNVGAIQSTETIAKPQSITEPKSLADFTGDGIPDLVFHANAFPSFTVIPLSVDGSRNTEKSFTCPMFITLPSASRD